ncbi:MAG: dihydroneopterin aldolase [Bacteroidales bacterium]|nr:dihydroneopterin aldolase [Bacteroidales bacterium]MDE7072678.1 dihydroneopterin aldolase [Bacteroidales bacterium]
MKNSCLSIEGMTFYAHHGCFTEERAIGTWFTIDIYLYTDTREAQRTDNLEATVNYAEVYAKIKEEMNIPSKLMEHVAGRITDRILDEYPRVEEVRIRLKKLNPPLGEKILSAGVELTRTRNQ